MRETLISRGALAPGLDRVHGPALSCAPILHILSSRAATATPPATIVSRARGLADDSFAVPNASSIDTGVADAHDRRVTFEIRYLRTLREARRRLVTLR